ncbi:hypothetical protein I8J29_11325 [Paenibacillus sp. MWE-103]|uniref:PrsW family intramembrane metalloprotease n=1 Tax=Paenibacillus artemisiicola TaxID=1172618 RepID=A0ABS3W9F2_9BACL|nr:hypothetical protein [Paenibacillus artemisiicola]MBO7744791.1 hypothetical protein [Paenibacillus artemisiicola]
MWTIAGLIAIAGICAALEWPLLKGSRRDLWTFGLLLLAGLGVGVAEALHARLPNPLDFVAAVFEPMGEGMRDFFDIRG